MWAVWDKDDYDQGQDGTESLESLHCADFFLCHREWLRMNVRVKSRWLGQCGHTKDRELPSGIPYLVLPDDRHRLIFQACQWGGIYYGVFPVDLYKCKKYWWASGRLISVLGGCLRVTGGKLGKVLLELEAVQVLVGTYCVTLVPL